MFQSVFPALYLESQAKTQFLPEHTMLLNFRCGDEQTFSKLKQSQKTNSLLCVQLRPLKWKLLKVISLSTCYALSSCLAAYSQSVWPFIFPLHLTLLPELLMCGECPSRNPNNNQIYSLDRLASFSSCSRSHFCRLMPWNFQCNIRCPCHFFPVKWNLLHYLEHDFHS